LLLASACFYIAWNWRLLPVLVAGSLLDYVLARALERAVNGETAHGITVKRVTLACSLVASLGTLAFFKYEAFFASSLNALLSRFGLAPGIPVLSVVLPLGISFYTIQRVGYILDVYWGRQRASRSLLNFMLFCSFFPQITSGPISRGHELLPQFDVARRISATALMSAAGTFLVGYALDAWAAAILGSKIVNPVFAGGSSFGVGSHWLAAVGYALQIFSDFAGYSLMAIAVAGAFGIRIPDNFNFPVFSTSLPEVWRRWHMTLNRWLFDYIFTPLTTSRGWFRGRYDVALALTFLASGLWHGASWTFLLWGAMHGAGMIVHRHWDESLRMLSRRSRAIVQARRSSYYRAAAWALTVGFFVLSLVPFRAPSLAAASEFARNMLVDHGGASLNLTIGTWAALAFPIVYHLVNAPALSSVRRAWGGFPAVVQGAATGAFIVFLLIVTPVSPGTFIYQQF
jgi:alginate O-acetyltransferase complex protein AlgI